MFRNMTLLGFSSLAYKCHNCFFSFPSVHSVQISFRDSQVKPDGPGALSAKVWNETFLLYESLITKIYWGNFLELSSVDSLSPKFFINLFLSVCCLAFGLLFQTENFSLINLKHQL